MGCNCKKTKVEEPVIELLKQLTQEEIDWFNNIDTITPLKNGEDIKTTSTDGDSK
jgi:hypothetical protein